MTVAELLSALEVKGTPMNKGDYEFVDGPDGTTHILICTDVDVSYNTRDGGEDRSYTFVCACEVFNRTGIKTSQITVAKTISCFACSMKQL